MIKPCAIGAHLRFKTGAQLRFYAALGFLLWSVLPHFSLYLHAHGRDTQGHVHQSFSPSQVALAQSLAASVVAAYGEASLSPSFGLSDETSARRTGSGAGETALASSPPSLHAHYQEEANATLTPWEAPARQVLPAPPSVSPFRPSPAILRPVRAVQARGPPVLPS